MDVLAVVPVLKPLEVRVSASLSYATAGELFGHLRTALRFGDLTMFVPLDRQPAVVYRWRFKAGGKWYSCEETVLLYELEHLPSAEVLAERLSDKWKNLHRFKTEVEP